MLEIMIEIKDKNIRELLVGEITTNDIVDIIFNKLDNVLLDRNQIVIDFQRVTFISVYFLERLENFVNRAKDLDVRVKIANVEPSIYKVFQVGRIKEVLGVCN